MARRRDRSSQGVGWGLESLRLWPERVSPAKTGPGLANLLGAEMDEGLGFGGESSDGGGWFRGMARGGTGPRRVSEAV